jgi:hypothetical protein
MYGSKFTLIPVHTASMQKIRGSWAVSKWFNNETREWAVSRVAQGWLKLNCLEISMKLTGASFIILLGLLFYKKPGRFNRKLALYLLLAVGTSLVLFNSLYKSSGEELLQNTWLLLIPFFIGLAEYDLPGAWLHSITGNLKRHDTSEQ